MNRNDESPIGDGARCHFPEYVVGMPMKDEVCCFLGASALGERNEHGVPTVTSNARSVSMSRLL